MEDNHLEEALVAIRRVMRATEINSLSLAKKSQLTPTQHIVLQIIASKKHTTPSHISYITTLRHTTIATVINKLLSRDLITREKEVKKILKEGGYSVPSVLDNELKINPFLRFDHKDVICSVENHFNLKLNKESEVFKYTRQWKDNEYD